jgi:hypothetical protein
MAGRQTRRRPSVLVLAFTLAACLAASLAACTSGGPGPSAKAWTKAGADEATTTRDSSDCRAVAKQEADRRYPHGFSIQTAGPAAMAMTQQHEETSRSLAEVEAFDRCMRGKGYAQTPVPSR